jgi:hypothetical protein
MILLIPFAVIIAMGVVGPQRLWIILAVLGALVAAGGAAVLRGRPSSALGWLYLGLGIVTVAASIHIAVTPA